MGEGAKRIAPVEAPVRPARTGLLGRLRPGRRPDAALQASHAPAPRRFEGEVLTIDEARRRLATERPEHEFKRFERFYEAHRAEFGAAYTIARERSGADALGFCRSVLSGLETLAEHDPRFQSLTPSNRLDEMFHTWGLVAGAPPIPRLRPPEIIFAYNVGLTERTVSTSSAVFNALSLTFLTALANRGKPEARIVDRLADHGEYAQFVNGLKFITRLYHMELERIEKQAGKEREARAAAARKRAERAEDEAAAERQIIARAEQRRDEVKARLQKLMAKIAGTKLRLEIRDDVLHEVVAVEAAAVVDRVLLMEILIEVGKITDLALNPETKRAEPAVIKAAERLIVEVAALVNVYGVDFAGEDHLPEQLAALAEPLLAVKNKSAAHDIYVARVIRGLELFALADKPHSRSAEGRLQVLEEIGALPAARQEAFFAAAYRWGRLVEAQSEQPTEASVALTALSTYLARYVSGGDGRNAVLKLFDDPAALDNFVLGYRRIIADRLESFRAFVEQGELTKGVFDRPLRSPAKPWPTPVETLVAAGKLAKRIGAAIEREDVTAVKNMLIDFLAPCGSEEFAPLSLAQWQKLHLLEGRLLQAGPKAIPLLLAVASRVQTREYIAAVRNLADGFLVARLISITQAEPQAAVSVLLDSFLARAAEDKLEFYRPGAEIEGRALLGARVSIYPLLQRFSAIIPARFTSKYAGLLRLLNLKTWRQAEALDGLILLLLEDGEILAATKRDLRSGTANAEMLKLAPLIANRLSDHTHHPSSAN